MSKITVSREIAGRTMTLETGKLAKQANSAITIKYGETVVLVTVLCAAPDREIDFFPLFVDYREAAYSAGKIPGGFFKREGRPSTKEILTMRMIDRPIRPLFPYDYRNEVQIQCMVLSVDEDNDPDLLALIGASAALTTSSAPFEGPCGAARIGCVDGEMVVFPTHDQLDQSTFELVGSGPKEALNMIEFSGDQISEEDVAKATELAQQTSCEVISLIEEFAKEMGEVEVDYEPTVMPEELKAIVKDRCEAGIREKKLIPGKQERNEALSELRQTVIDELIPEDADPETLPYTEAQIKEVFYKLEGAIQRELILDGKRPDGRAHEELRPLHSEVDVLPRTHGSAIFQRGETQAMVIATLGTPRDQPIIDGLREEYKKPFFLHYNFPPFSVGEIRPLRGPGRREIGHGALAEKSISPVMPSNEEFPYTVRVVAELLESNGSTSQAATCGAVLALLDAGVPLKTPVAGISIGMVSDDEGKYVLLTDIVGEEDFHGDMDFKVAGTKNGITGIQLDMKARGITQDRIPAVLEQARKARLELLENMTAAISEPSELSPYAPRMLSVMIDPDKIGKVIGPGGKMIKKIQEETGASIDIEEDGTIYIASAGEGADEAKKWVQAITEDPEIGKIYIGKVVGMREFGAFVEILPGQEGLCHVSELSDEYVEDPNNFCKIGDDMEVRIIGIDDSGKIKVSRKAAMNAEWTPEDNPPRSGGNRRSGGRGGDRRGGGDRRRGGRRD